MSELVTTPVSTAGPLDPAPAVLALRLATRLFEAHLTLLQRLLEMQAGAAAILASWRWPAPAPDPDVIDAGEAPLAAASRALTGVVLDWQRELGRQAVGQAMQMARPWFAAAGSAS